MPRGRKPRIPSSTADAAETTRSAEELAIDGHVGSRLRLRRSLLGMSQSSLADSIGMTFQQVQKYERGSNRISASKLHRLSQVLDVPVSYFFEGLPGQGGKPAETSATDTGLPTFRRQHLRLVRYFNAMPADTAKSFFDLARTLAKQGGGDVGTDDGVG